MRSVHRLIMILKQQSKQFFSLLKWKLEFHRKRYSWTDYNTSSPTLCCYSFLIQSLQLNIEVGELLRSKTWAGRFEMFLSEVFLWSASLYLFSTIFLSLWATLSSMFTKIIVLHDLLPEQAVSDFWTTIWSCKWISLLSGWSECQYFIRRVSAV